MILKYKAGHVKALDGMRGIAILLVIMTHFYRMGPLKTIGGIGWVGVDLFFVLSGFLITGILLDSRSGKHYYKNFIIKRVLRILPIYYLVLFSFSILSLLSHNPAFAFPGHLQLPFWLYFQNIAYAINKGWFYDGSPRFFNHFWSLAVEEQFYIFWPLIVYYFSGKNIIKISFILITISITIRNIFPFYPFAYVFTFARVDGLLIGAIIAVLVRENIGLLEKWLVPVFSISVVGIGLILFFGGPLDSSELWIRIGYTLNASLFGSILLFVFLNNRFGTLIKNVYESHILTFFGKYSYGIYIFHYIVFRIMREKVLVIIMHLFHTDSSSFSLEFTASTICFLFTILVSYSSYNLFEKRFLALKAKLTFSESSDKVNRQIKKERI